MVGEYRPRFQVLYDMDNTTVLGTYDLYLQQKNNKMSDTLMPPKHPSFEKQDPDIWPRP